MEEEEREAQSAKLQELIRRGSPEDLREANRLMKIMAGYDTRSKTDYRAKAAEDVSKIQAKARLLEERLEAFKSGDRMSDGDVFSELAAALQSAQPKIQKMCEEESEDHEAVARLLEINDSIHRTVERYKLMKKGDMEAAAKVASGAAPPVSSVHSGHAANELSLIDFDGEGGHDASQSNGTSTSNCSQAGGLENDLLGLDIGGSSSSAFGQGGNISLGFGANSSKLNSHGDSTVSGGLKILLVLCLLTQSWLNRYPRSGSTIFCHTRQHRRRQHVGPKPNRIIFSVCILHITTALAVGHSPAFSSATAEASSSEPGVCRSIRSPSFGFNADVLPTDHSSVRQRRR